MALLNLQARRPEKRRSAKDCYTVAQRRAAPLSAAQRRSAPLSAAQRRSAQVSSRIIARQLY